MKIIFALPTLSYGPAGGYKVVYEYANRLVKDGYDVEIIYSALIANRGALSNAKKIFYLAVNYLKGKRNARWMWIDKRVKHTVVLSFKTKLPKADIYIATSAQTARPISENKHIYASAKRFYFIQGYENWGMREDRLHATYQLPNLKKFAIAKWLKNKIESISGSNSVSIVPNGFDAEKFFLTTPVEEKRPYRICMLYSNSAVKGCDDALHAVEIARRSVDSIELVMFGVPERPTDLPEWVTYYNQPSIDLLRKIYDESAIYISASINEGWGLTLGEAAMCGCAIVCTDIGGFREMVEPDLTALMSSPNNPQALAKNIVKLCLDAPLRIKLAKNVMEHIRQFLFENSYKKLLAVLGIIQ